MSSDELGGFQRSSLPKWERLKPALGAVMWNALAHTRLDLDETSFQRALGSEQAAGAFENADHTLVRAHLVGSAMKNDSWSAKDLATAANSEELRSKRLAFTEGDVLRRRNEMLIAADFALRVIGFDGVTTDAVLSFLKDELK